MERILSEILDYLKHNNKHTDINQLSSLMKIRALKHRHIQSIDEAVNLDEIERFAQHKLDFNALSYYMTGAMDEHTLFRNKDIFRKIQIYPKVLVDVSNVNTSTTILGDKISFPICLAPSALHRLAHNEGEINTAKSALKNNTIMCLSSLSSSTLEDVAIANGNGLRWFQLYIMKNRDHTLRLIRQCEASGYKAIVVTVDAPAMGYRDKEFQSKFRVPDNITYSNLLFLKKKFEEKQENENLNVNNNSEISISFNENIDPSLTWESIKWIKSITKLKIILKGIHRLDDAIKALEYQVDGIIVSNHGARQIDTVPSTMEMLNEITKVLRGTTMEIYVDGGFTRGTDVFKALALGAKAVFLGRPVLWGLAADGQKGVDKVLEILQKELISVMKLAGCPSVSDINRDFIRFPVNLSKF